MARPSAYNEEIAEQICSRIASGESLRRMCREDDSLPAESTVYLWLLRHEEFSEKYTRAREFQTEPFAEDIVEIADDPTIDPNDKRVRIDTRKWLMGKLKAKRYGEKQQVEHSGQIGLGQALDSLPN